MSQDEAMEVSRTVFLKLSGRDRKALVRSIAIFTEKKILLTLF